MKERHRLILGTLKDLGQQATTREIAKKLNLSTNGVSQSLSALCNQNGKKYVECLGGHGGETEWKLLRMM